MSDRVVEHTPDGRYLVVDGRRWRATDPGIPEKLRAELVAELMAARRAVRSEPETARPRVHDAKIALGERGDPWWDEPSEAGRRSRVEATIRTLLRHRGEAKTICPSDVSRVVGGESWRDLMDLVRDLAAELAAAGTVVVTQRGEAVDATQARGPVRIGRGPRWG